MPEVEEAGTAQTEVPHEGPGMPQLNPDYFGPQIFWLVLSFALLYFLMSRVALPRVAGFIEERRDKIADDLDKAANLKKDADTALAAYEEALADARGRAHAITGETREKLKAETDQLRADLESKLAAQASEAEAKIRRAKDAALAHMKPVASEVAAVIVSKLLGETIDGEAARRAVEIELSGL